MSAVATATAVSIAINTDEKNRQTFTLTFDKTDAESMKLGKGVLTTLQRSEFDSHKAIAAEMAKTPSPVVTLNPSALKLVAEATADNSNPIVQAFHADVTAQLETAGQVRAENKAAREAAKAEKKASKPAPAAKTADDSSVLARKVETLTHMLVATGVSNQVITEAMAQIENA